MKYTKVAIWGLASAGLGIGVGCSDSTIIYDPSFDGSVAVDSTLPRPDALTDTGSPGDTGSPDATMADGGDAAKVDSGPGDSGPGDSGPGDSGPGDAGRDGGQFVSSDAGDGGTVVTLRYAENVAAALCANLAGCCGGVFNSSKCETTLKRGGIDNIWQGLEVPGVSTGGRVTVNDTLSDQCFALIAATNLCNPYGGATSRDLMAKCGGAVQGTIARGASCHADIECVPGNHCAGMNPSAGIDGVCAATSTVGQPCEYIQAGYRGRVTNCSTRGQGDSNLYCSEASLTCQPLKPVSDTSTCVASFECANQYCTLNLAGDNTVCGDAPLDQGLCFFGL